MILKNLKDTILSSVKILDLAEEFEISVEEISSGNFTHRCRCPSDKHKAGSERTGSLYIDGNNNNFYCFGCGATSNVIDFYILITNKTFSESMQYLSTLVDPNNVSSPIDEEVKVSTFDECLKISNMFRAYITKYPDDFDWIDGIIKQADQYLEDIGRYEVDRTKSLRRKLLSTLRQRRAVLCE